MTTEMSSAVATARRFEATVSPASSCSHCNLRELCLPQGASPDEMQRLGNLVARRRRLRRGESLYRCGAAFDALYAIRSGFFKTVVSTDDGREHVTDFSMSGDLLGLDGYAAGRHDSDAIALEDSQVCVVPRERIDRPRGYPAGAGAGIQHRLLRALSSEVVRSHRSMLLLGRLRAEERLAAFLVDLSHRLHARGYSASALVLRMSRAEIGAHLGLTLETVSRGLSKLHDDGLLQVRHRHIRIIDAAALRQRLAFATA